MILYNLIDWFVLICQSFSSHNTTDGTWRQSCLCSLQRWHKPILVILFRSFVFLFLFLLCFVLFCFVCFGFFLRFQTLLYYLAFQSLTLRVTDEGYSEIPETRLYINVFITRPLSLNVSWWYQWTPKLLYLVTNEKQKKIVGTVPKCIRNIVEAEAQSILHDRSLTFLALYIPAQPAPSFRSISWSHYFRFD